MSLGDVAGYRWVLQGQYDVLFRDRRPEDVQRLQQACRDYLDAVLGALNLPDEGRYLDLGCGAGWVALEAAARSPLLEVVGLDASSEAVRVAREAAQAQGLANAAFVEGDAEEPPGGPYQRVTSLSLFNLLPDKKAALEGWRRVAAPEARLVLSDAFVTSGRGTMRAGAMRDEAFLLLARRTGWRVLQRRDLTPLVRRLHAAQAWPWSEYVRDGYRYLLLTMEPR